MSYFEDHTREPRLYLYNAGTCFRLAGESRVRYSKGHVCVHWYVWHLPVIIICRCLAVNNPRLQRALALAWCARVISLSSVRGLNSMKKKKKRIVVKLSGPCSTYHRVFGIHFSVKSAVPAISSRKNNKEAFSIIVAT